MSTKPHITANNPFSAWNFIRRAEQDRLGRLKALFDQYGDVVQIEIMGQRQAIIRHPDHLHRILVEDVAQFPKDRSYTDAQRGLARFLGTGLLTSAGDFWKRQRKLTAPALHHKRIAGYAGMIVDFTQRLMDTWKNGDVIDVDRAMMHTTLDIVTHSLFNVNVADDSARIAAAVDVMQIQAVTMDGLGILLPQWVPTPQRTAEARAVRDLDRIVYRIIRERRAEGDVDRGDLLSMLLQVRDDDDQGMSDRQIRDEVVTIFLAGHETTANLLNWTWVLLDQHPDIAHRLHNELDSVLNGRLPTLEDVKCLPYTEMVVKEAMRLYPPAFAISRMAAQDADFDGVHIPAETTLVLMIHAMHHDARWWPNPEAFQPERFHPDNDHPLNRRAYLPFGDGPRVCIGNGFAMMEAVLIVAQIASRYTLALEGEVPEVSPMLTLRPKNGLRMRLRERAATAQRVAAEAAL